MKYWIFGICCIVASTFSSYILMTAGIISVCLGICKLVEEHLPKSVKNYVELL